MREIVCICTAEEVKGFLATNREVISRFCDDLQLPVRWEHATDPFFNPSRNANHLMQKLDPLKTELVFQNRLAIASINFHQDHFGDAFGIQRDGTAAFSGCVAFGVDRWLYARLTGFGPDESNWPDLVTRGL